MTAALQIFGVLLLALGALCASRAKPTSEHTGFVRAGDVLWSGEKLYVAVGTGQAPTPLFVVLGGNENCVAPNGQTFRGVKVRYPNGNEVWKPRATIARSTYYFVKKSDPALASKNMAHIRPVEGTTKACVPLRRGIYNFC